MTFTVNTKENPKILEDFLEYLQVIKCYTSNTIRGYNLDLLQFFNFIKEYQRLSIEIKDFNIFTLMQVKTSDIIAFLVFLNYKKDSNPYTRQRKLSSIRRFYKWLISLYPKALQKNPADDIENIQKIQRLPKYLSLDQAQKLQKIFTIKNCNYPLRNNAIISLFLSTGMRLSELININICDVNFETNSIKIKGKGHKERTVYFSTACKLKLQNYINFRTRKNQTTDINSSLFLNNKGKPIGADCVEYICKKAYKLAGLEDYNYNIHTLRHTAATIMYRYVTQDILLLQKFLGHKYISTTEIYTHTYNKELIDAINRHPLNCTQKIA